MSIPKCKRFFKKCEEFSICAEIGEAGFVGIEHSEQRRTLYQYFLRGSVSFNTLNDDGLSRRKVVKYDDSTRYTLTDTKEFLNEHIVLRAEDDFSIIGFNTFEKNVDWDGKIVTESFVCDNDTSYLICFDGNPIVNDNELRQYDYSKLVKGKEYNISTNDGVVGVFTKLC